jgi:hypothetical protein
MEFTIMAWNSGNVRASSIFGVIDKENPGQLPKISDKGHWTDFKTIAERHFPEAEAAKKSIADIGYYIIGGDVTTLERVGFQAKVLTQPRRP